MKFCPQCGTTFEPDARFCLECGFDRSSVEAVLTEQTQDLKEIVKEAPEVPVAPEKNPGCPQCGTTVSKVDRFCPECGFDSTSPVIAGPVASKIPVAEEVIPDVNPQQEPPPKEATKQFCPQCGTVISGDDRFCQECGFDSTLQESAAQPGFVPVDQPEVKYESTNTPVATNPVIPPTPVKLPEPVIPPVRKTDTQLQQPNLPPVIARETGSGKKEKNRWPLILLIIAGIAVLGAGGWFAYNKFMASPTETLADSAATISEPEIAFTDTTSLETETTEVTEQPVAEPPKTPAKPQSKIDQELAKYRDKEKSKTTQQTPPAQPSKPDLGVKVSSNTTVNNILSEVIHEVGRKEEPKNKKPKNPAKFTLQKPMVIVRITTDHYNDGMGTSGGGTISIKDRDGNVLGSYKAVGKTGTGGAPNAKWVAEPQKVLDKGTYYIWDSDFSTWSKTLLGNGFVVVEGYEVK